MLEEKAALYRLLDYICSTSGEWEVVFKTLLRSQNPCFKKDCNLNLHPLISSFIQQKLLYSHQAEALYHLGLGHNICVATPTASGKSLIYNLGVLNAFTLEPSTKALYIFPLKALAQDQAKKLQNLAKTIGLKIKVEIYDGDTSSWKRKKIRENPPDILITNPEMLHLGMLPHFHLWENFFKYLKFIVVDEVHTYRGIFGSHLAWVFRRLKRLCNYLGTNFQWIFCSATIANPLELVSQLTAISPVLIKESGAPKGELHFLVLRGLFNPAGACLKMLQQTKELGLRTIVFTKSRKMTELISMWASKRQSKVVPYRAGFLPIERRKIENSLFSGEINTVVSTSALELGVDIGKLDVCVLVGYPGSIMSLWQRIGRVGRSGRPSLVVYLGLEDSIDEYFLQHPKELLTAPLEKAVLNPFNPYILKQHLMCVLAEHALSREEINKSGIAQTLEELWQEGRILRTQTGDFVSKEKNPQRKINLRGIGKRYNLFENNKWIGDIDGFRVYKETHPGAIYLHAGKEYLVEQIDEERKVVILRKIRSTYYTRAIVEKQTTILEINRQQQWDNFYIFQGKLQITEQVIGYEKRKKGLNFLLGKVDLDLPKIEFETQGFWVKIPENTRCLVEQQNFHFMGGIHGLEHLLIGLLPLILLADRNDFGGISTPFHLQVEGAGVFIYDAYPGGAGLSEQAFEQIKYLLKRASKMLFACKCENGCPKCIQSPKCGSGNRPLDKRATKVILQDLLKIVSKNILKIQKIEKAEAKKVKVKVNLTKNFAVLDLETKFLAQEVGGWHKAHKMGISCVGVYFSEKDSIIFFQDSELQKLWELLLKQDLIVGFNILGFDFKVLQGSLKRSWYDLPTLDLLLEIKKKLGYRLSLDHLAQYTLNAQKKGNGLLAVKWWREGKIEKIIEYCKHDVFLTKELYLFGRKNGYLCFKNKAGQIVHVPVHWR